MHPLDRPLDVAVVAVYVVATLTLGLLLAGRQRDAGDYFLGHRGLPWWAIMLSIVATETSAVTVISVPGIAATGNLTFLQLPLGYLAGRIGVAALLLPGYFAGTQETAYARLEHRFGPGARRAAAAIFLGTRSVADAVRVFATAIPLAIITRWSLPAGILAVGVVTLVYTWIGGLRAVVWVDVMQLGVYVLGGVATLIVALGMAGGSFATALQAGKLQVFDFHFSFARTYTFWGGLIGGALLSAASHGTDHLLVQRLLAAKGLRDARRALIGSGLCVIVLFALFLLVGTSLWLAGAAQPGSGLRSDAIYPTFVINALPAGLAGLVVAGILAAAMGTHASAINALASATTYDFYAGLTGRRDPAHLLRVGRAASLGWALVLVAGAMLFRDQNTPVVQLALSVASLTYGSLLGMYVLASVHRAREIDAIVAVAVGMTLLAPVVLGAVIPHFPVHWLPSLAWPWYVPLGTAVTVTIGMLSSFVGRPDEPAPREARGRTVGP